VGPWELAWQCSASAGLQIHTVHIPEIDPQYCQHILIVSYTIFIFQLTCPLLNHTSTASSSRPSGWSSHSPSGSGTSSRGASATYSPAWHVAEKLECFLGLVSALLWGCCLRCNKARSRLAHEQGVNDFLAQRLACDKGC
jgi:hypothetical protein